MERAINTIKAIITIKAIKAIKYKTQFHKLPELPELPKMCKKQGAAGSQKGLLGAFETKHLINCHIAYISYGY